jgi:hypothetical protein
MGWGVWDPKVEQAYKKVLDPIIAFYVIINNVVSKSRCPMLILPL